MAERTAVYRHYSAEGILLYVGVSVNPHARTSQHRRSADWFGQVSEIKLDWHKDRKSAEKAEVAAIVSESPVFNANWSGGLSRADKMLLQSGLSLSDFPSRICVARGPHNMFHAQAARYGVGKSDIMFGDAALERAVKSAKPDTDLIVCLGRLRPNAELDRLARRLGVLVVTNDNLFDWLGKREPGDLKPPAGLII